LKQWTETNDEEKSGSLRRRLSAAPLKPAAGESTECESEFSPSTFVGGPIEAGLLAIPAQMPRGSPSTFVGGPIEADLPLISAAPTTVLSVDVCRRPH